MDRDPIDAALEKMEAAPTGQLGVQYALTFFTKMEPRFADETTRDDTELAIHEWAGDNEIRKGLANAWLTRAKGILGSQTPSQNSNGGTKPPASGASAASKAAQAASTGAKFNPKAKIPMKGTGEAQHSENEDDVDPNDEASAASASEQAASGSLKSKTGVVSGDRPGKPKSVGGGQHSSNEADVAPNNAASSASAAMMAASTSVKPMIVNGNSMPSMKGTEVGRGMVNKSYDPRMEEARSAARTTRHRSLFHMAIDQSPDPDDDDDGWDGEADGGQVHYGTLPTPGEAVARQAGRIRVRDTDDGLRRIGKAEETRGLFKSFDENKHKREHGKFAGQKGLFSGGVTRVQKPPHRFETYTANKGEPLTMGHVHHLVGNAAIGAGIGALGRLGARAFVSSNSGFDYAEYPLHAGVGRAAKIGALVGGGLSLAEMIHAHKKRMEHRIVTP